jgi:hypothetical protein
VRIDSACNVEDWSKDPAGNQAKIARTFNEACDVAEGFGERLAAEGEICWGGMHSWKKMVELLQRVSRPRTLGFQADMAHTLLYVLGYNAPEDAILPPDWDWSDAHLLNEAMKTLTRALRAWTIDFHVAQNDATVHGSGTHDKTGHHCLPNDPKGKLTITHHAGYWLHGDDGGLTKACRHICWDGCMFPNEVMMKPDTWNDILRTMLAVRDAHGWHEEKEAAAPKPARAVEVTPNRAAARPSAERAKPARRQAAPKAAKAPGRKTAAKPTRKTGARPKPRPQKPVAKAKLRKPKGAGRAAAQPKRPKRRKR